MWSEHSFEPNPPVARSRGEDRGWRDETYVDLEVLSELREVLSTELFAKHLSAFVEEAKGMSAILRSLSRERETARLSDLAHKFSGAAAVFGAGALRDALARIEAAVRGDRTDRLDILVHAIEHLASRTIVALARVRYP